MCLHWGTKERGFCPGWSVNFMVGKASPPPRAHNGLRGLTLKGQRQRNTHQLPPEWLISALVLVGRWGGKKEIGGKGGRRQIQKRAKGR